jgi:response regulator RpfG family c-di-GMP phosphodiesterase
MADTFTRDSCVLVVDDEKSICDIIAQYLRRQGYAVQMASCAEEAVEFIRSQPVDLVLTDIKMPGMSGVDLLKWVKEFNHFLPVVITTGFPTLDTAIEALKLGAFDYLTKPFHLEEIGEKIRRALMSRQLEEENLLFSKLVSLHEVTKVLSSTHRIGDLNLRFLDYSVKIGRADAGALMFYDNNSRLFIAETAPATVDANFWNSRVFISGSQWVAQSEEPLVLDASNQNVPAGVVPLPPEIQSYIVFPLKTPQRLLGVLNLVRMRGNMSFSNVDLELINVLSSQASISIENARLYHNIRDNYLKTIRGFALAVEAKDRYTHGHSENVMKYTVVLAKYMGLSAQEIEQIKYAGLLHDIGKIGVSESILNKPGRLTPEEFEEIKAHPEIGARIISDVPFLKSLVPIVKHHHEFFNGQGYPDHIAGDQIPLGARILSIADAFEAMTSNRPYRKAMPYEVAMEILFNQKNLQFQPDLVDIFLEIIQRGKLHE